jgi:hypothetical protein
LAKWLSLPLFKKKNRLFENDILNDSFLSYLSAMMVSAAKFESDRIDVVHRINVKYT